MRFRAHRNGYVKRSGNASTQLKDEMGVRTSPDRLDRPAGHRRAGLLRRDAPVAAVVHGIEVRRPMA